MEDSILTTIKQLLGIEEAVTDFDVEIITDINSVFLVLQQLGIGPEEGFSIADKTTTWASYIGTNNNLNAVKTYMYLKVKQMFDPPSSGFTTDSMERLIKEFEWRLNVQVDPGKEES